MASMVKTVIKFSTLAGLALGSGFYIHSEQKKKFFINVQAVNGNALTPGSPVTATDISTRIQKVGMPSFRLPLVKQNFIVLHNNEKRIPSCVLEHLTKENIVGSACRSNQKFHEDPDIEEIFRATVSDYSETRYDKGHFAPSSNHKASKDYLKDTFLLSNVGPMDRKLNRGKWDDLEKRVQNLTEEYTHVYVYTGSLFLPREKDGRTIIEYEVFGKNHVAVPTHYYKFILAETENKEFHSFTYVLENRSTKEDLKNFFRDRTFVEKAAGYRIAPFISDEFIRKINGEDNPHYNNIQKIDMIKLRDTLI